MWCGWIVILLHIFFSFLPQLRPQTSGATGDVLILKNGRLYTFLPISKCSRLKVWNEIAKVWGVPIHYNSHVLLWSHDLVSSCYGVWSAPFQRQIQCEMMHWKLWYVTPYLCEFGVTVLRNVWTKPFAFLAQHFLDILSDLPSFNRSIIPPHVTWEHLPWCQATGVQPGLLRPAQTRPWGWG